MAYGYVFSCLLHDPFLLMKLLSVYFLDISQVLLYVNYNLFGHLIANIMLKNPKITIFLRAFSIEQERKDEGS